MKIQEFVIEPRYKKENGLYILDINSIKIPFEVKDISVVNIPPKQFGGNHKHPRQEAFVGIGEELELIWMDGNKRMTKKMNPEGKNILFVIPSDLGHAVVNNSNSQFGILLEYASDSQKDVQICQML
ncbi:MAG: hypothetical protein Q7T51_04060 [Candidatus Moranbacteria bacterium]|nr:hypothetical protein [Candidatus Moranbacteria bacterium]